MIWNSGLLFGPPSTSASISVTAKKLQHDR